MKRPEAPAGIAGLEAEPVALVGLVSYQEGSVVSRILLKGETGSITLFAFDQGQELSEHTAPFDALALILEGEAEIVISGRAFQVGTGEAVLLPARKPHALKATRKLKMLLVMLRP